MKTRLASRRAFTLIEILVVITIIAVLVTLALPSITAAFRTARVVDTRNTMTGLITAINNYHADYSRLPLEPRAAKDTEMALTSGNDLLKVLLGENVNRMNPTNRAYLDNPQMGKRGAGGLVGKDNQFSLVDCWGQPFRVVMDGNADDKVPNPDIRNADESIRGEAPTLLPRKAAAYSAGPDGQFGTRDDVTSWR
jgi:prepilin-type N-terminal cleavage/methylation domain-containing protein